MDQQELKTPPEESLNLVYIGAEKFQPGDEYLKKYALFKYYPGDKLREAVNLAIYLNRPLLIKGEPGSGKTRLALAVAHEFTQTHYLDLRDYEYQGDREDKEEVDDKGYRGWPFFFWPVKSTSQALDGLYTYDAVGRLHDAGLPKEERKKKEVAEYIRYGALGKAFHFRVMRPIVLIDEIDKADIDFPNDLLIELEDPKFKVKELDDKLVGTGLKPIIFVTSNDEKDLPDAFLRRCIFYYIDFPDPEDLQMIVMGRIPDHDEKLVKKAVGVFLKMRDRLKEKKGSARKLPSTSELIDWVQALHRNTELTDLDQALSSEAFQAKKGKNEILAYFEDMSAPEKLMAGQVMSLLDDQTPFLSVLIKDHNDYLDYVKEENEERKQNQKRDGEDRQESEQE